MPRSRLAGGLAGLLVAAGGLAAADSAYGVAGGTPAADGEFAFVAHVKVGNLVRSCTGALIDPEWVITATACFSENGQPVPAGPPTPATTVTVGRTDAAATTGGQVRTVTQLVPHATRNVVLAKLATPVIDVTPATIGTTAPAPGESLRVAGFGRTATTWAPGRLTTALLGVQAVADTTIDLSGPAGSGVICKGDAGGPTFRPRADGGGELVALHTSSTQSGCIGVPASDTPALAVDTRLDNIADWIGQTVRGGAFVRLP
ncbi:MAG TPA: S1 family peptidase, partial [Actinoplanes sp.]|nr:S1 family peptidase [Actinoplanes sp.]